VRCLRKEKKRKGKKTQLKSRKQGRKKERALNVKRAVYVAHMVSPSEPAESGGGGLVGFLSVYVREEYRENIDLVESDEIMRE